ncbi:MAG: hypothetical protein AB1938_11880 [Myxococcota bacterium]
MAMDVREWAERMRASHERKDREEAEAWWAMGPEGRMREFAALCRSAMLVLTALTPERRAAALEYRDPLPDSSQRHLARLRAEHAAQRNRA